MFRIECCNGMRKCRVFSLVCQKKFSNVIMKCAYCSVCGSFVVEIIREEISGRVSRVIKRNEAGYSLYEKNLKNILYEIKPMVMCNKSRWYLRYSDRGKIRKCYSNLSSLRIGRVADF